MRILQLIDSLRPGGAEKMAVNIANALLPHVDGSYLCCTRQEGILKDQLKPEVGYLFLNKKNSLDPKAIFKLRKFIQKNRIDIVHAHSTSYFLAGLLKVTGGRFKLIWHDHYGNSNFLCKRAIYPLKFFSEFFSKIIAVNSALGNWSKEKINFKNVSVIRNFIPEGFASNESVQLKGDNKAYKIICVANLRPQKDHSNLINAFLHLEKGVNTSLHLIGEDPKNEYSMKLIKEFEEEKNIYFYGPVKNVSAYLNKADLGVLSSKSEGLPLAILEYAIAKLPVVSTNVGEIEKVLKNDAKHVVAENPELLSQAILYYINNPDLAGKDAHNLQLRIRNDYSERIVVQQFILVYKEILDLI